MRPTKFIACICLFLDCFFADGQTSPQKDNGFDEKYSPAQNSIFNNTRKKNQDSPSGSIDIKNSIKFCPTMLFRQKAVFFYEREITSGLAVNVGLGKAFGKDVIESLFFDEFSTNSVPYTLSPGEMLVNGEHDGSSPFLSVGLRLYYSGSTFDGGFIDIGYRRETMNYMLPATINSNRVEGSRSASFKMNGFSFGYGYTAITGNKNNITHEFFMNFGIKLFEYTKFDEIQVVSSTNYGSTETVYRKTSTTLPARIAPAVNMGYSFGFGF